MNQENEQCNSKGLYRKSQKVLILMLLYSSLMYILILLILQTNLQTSHQYTTIFSTNFGIFAILFMILSAAFILLSHLLLIPYINKIKVKDSERVFILYINLINVSVVLISIFGYLIGFFGYSEYRFIDWVVVISFIAVGMIHGIYLYCTEISPWFRLLKKEIL